MLYPWNIFNLGLPVLLRACLFQVKTIDNETDSIKIKGREKEKQLVGHARVGWLDGWISEIF